jgi:hypothetical protein
MAQTVAQVLLHLIRRFLQVVLMALSPSGSSEEMEAEAVREVQAAREGAVAARMVAMPPVLEAMEETVAMVARAVKGEMAQISQSSHLNYIKGSSSLLQTQLAVELVEQAA